ncbi:hypothetical protein ACJRO7_022102 [Eucalyptus globulus]|uniref:Uncharacterized protein n=1 Tax=Eucalyptus globulus TaxID=34317 RepID=A0ABD3KMZ2_EUCGL
MAEQVTMMAIKVDLQCSRCYKKIQKILCEIPQVRDRIFNEKQNTVMITVVCCDPEKVRQKICCKGGEIILGIDIIPPKPDKEVPKQKPRKKEPPTQTDQSPPPTPQKQNPPPVPPPPVIGYPVPVMGGAYVCLPCHNQGCGWFCPCNCHCGRPSWPMCHDGCGKPAHECRCRRPPMCHDGCGKLAHECRCRRPPPMCHDGCGKPAHECRCRRPPPMCHDGCGKPAHECRCRRPPMCPDGCGRPSHECGCWRPSYPRCCDRCNYGSASSSWMPHRCDH